MCMPPGLMEFILLNILMMTVRNMKRSLTNMGAMFMHHTLFL